MFTPKINIYVSIIKNNYCTSQNKGRYLKFIIPKKRIDRARRALDLLGELNEQSTKQLEVMIA
jgi:hypothetical protein